MELTPDNVRTISWLPATCGYRLVAEGKDLFWWHPLVSGRAERSTKRAYRCMAASRRSESDMSEPEDYFSHMLNNEP